jgi:predicted nucleotidyltransferase
MPGKSKAMMFVNSDFSDLLRLFNANSVKYLIIGGYAVIQYAEPRYTKDLDVWISADKDNAAAIYKALKEFGAPLTEMTEADFTEEGYFYQMGRPPMRVDVLMGIPGVEFEKAWQHRVEVDFDGLLVKFISRADLIAAKKASGRPQDLIDVDLLSQTPGENE